MRAARSIRQIEKPAPAPGADRSGDDRASGRRPEQRAGGAAEAILRAVPIQRRGLRHLMLCRRGRGRLRRGGPGVQPDKRTRRQRPQQAAPRQFDRVRPHAQFPSNREITANFCWNHPPLCQILQCYQYVITYRHSHKTGNFFAITGKCFCRTGN
jgi:hypothetical protein